MAEFNIQAAFREVNDRFDTVDKNVREVCEQGIRNDSRLEGLLGNGQPGKIQRLEDEVDRLKAWKNKSAGFIVAVNAVIGMVVLLGHIIWDTLRGKH